MPTQALFKSAAVYDPIAGTLRGREDGDKRVGDFIWKANAEGRAWVHLADDRRYYADGLAFLYQLGKYPKHPVIHHDGDVTNLRWNNLALDPRDEFPEMASWYKLQGIERLANATLWAARVTAGDQVVPLGMFDTEHDAFDAWTTAYRLLMTPSPM